MHRHSTRGAGVALLVLLALVSAACGQKAGVAGSVTSASGGAITDTSGGDTGLSDTGGAVTETGGTASGGGPSAAPSKGGGTSSGSSGAGAPSTGGAGTTGTTPSGGATASGGSTPTEQLDRTGISKTEIKIGIHAPETGAAAVSTFQQAVGVYSQYAGNIKGLGGRHITVVAEDDRFDPATARNVCKKMVEKDHVFLLIGGAGVDQIKSCAEYAASKGVPYFSPGVTEGPFRNLSNYFALSETYNQQNVQLGQLIRNEVKKTRVGMVLTDSPLLNETEASFRMVAKANGLQIVYSGRLAHDAGKTQTDTQVSNLKAAKAEVVYTLISPTVFGSLVSSAKQQAFRPTFVGPGLSVGVNLVALAACPPPPYPDVRVLSPMVETDVIDHYDPAYKPAYEKKNKGGNPDDIGILLWGIEKAIRFMLEADGPDPSRQTLIKTLSSGKAFATNVYAPVHYGGLPHFGAKQVTLLKLDCGGLRYTTAKPFATGF